MLSKFIDLIRTLTETDLGFFLVKVIISAGMNAIYYKFKFEIPQVIMRTGNDKKKRISCLIVG